MPHYRVVGGAVVIALFEAGSARDAYTRGAEASARHRDCGGAAVHYQLQQQRGAAWVSVAGWSGSVGQATRGDAAGST
jgi:hypothetical protein